MAAGPLTPVFTDAACARDATCVAALRIYTTRGRRGVAARARYRRVRCTASAVPVCTYARRTACGRRCSLRDRRRTLDACTPGIPRRRRDARSPGAVNYRCSPPNHTQSTPRHPTSQSGPTDAYFTDQHSRNLRYRRPWRCYYVHQSTRQKSGLPILAADATCQRFTARTTSKICRGTCDLEGFVCNGESEPGNGVSSDCSCADR